MARSKKKQRLVYDPNIATLNNPPQWKPAGGKRAIQEIQPESSGSAAKRSRSDENRDTALLEALSKEFTRRLSMDIEKCYLNDEDLSRLKIDLKSRVSLPRGTVTEAEIRGGLETTELENCLKRLRKHKTPIQRWKDFIDQNFDELCDVVKSDVEEKGEGIRIEQRSQTTENVSTGSISTLEDESELIRTFSCGLSSIIRPNLPQDIKEAFFNRVSLATIDATDYISKYSLHVFKMVLLFQTSTFIMNEDGLTLQSRPGPRKQDVLPEGFPIDDRLEHLPSPIDKKCLENDDFAKEFDKLFNNLHLQRIHSECFGKEGQRKSKVERKIETLLLSSLPAIDNSSITADPYIMKMALSKYMTNFQNMWATNKRFYSLLNHVLIVLLRIHLAPLREARKRTLVKDRDKSSTSLEQDEYSSTIPVEEISIIRMTYNARKRLFNQERKRQEKYISKAVEGGPNADKWFEKSERCAERINTYENVLYTEKKGSPQTTQDPVNDDSDILMELQADSDPAVLQAYLYQEDMSELASKDSSARRINILKSIVRRAIFANIGDTISETILREALPDISDNELKVCLVIANFLTPYIPPKTKSTVIARQLPFILMSNSLLQITGYSKWAMKAVPITKPTSLLALKLDAPSIYTLACGFKESRKMYLFDFDGKVINSRQIATESKDGVFSSFFNIRKLHDLCKDHGLDFAHNMYILPGRKTVRVNGSLKKPSPLGIALKIPQEQQTSSSKGKSPASSTPKSRTLASSISKGKMKASSSTAPPKENVKAIQTELKTLQTEMQRLFKEQQTFYLNNSIGRLKKTWIASNDQELTDEKQKHNQELFHKIQKLKELRDGINQRLLNCRGKLVESRQSMYLKFSGDITGGDDGNQKRLITHDNFKCIDDVSALKIDKNLLDSDKLQFSGTDNGLVTMTETVGFSMEKFLYHLALYSEQEKLSSQEQTIQSLSFEKLPKPFKVHGSDIDFGSGGRYFRAHTENLKKKNDRRVIKLEGDLSRNSFYNVGSLNELSEREEIHFQNAAEIRNMYHSPHLSRKKRQYELKKNKFLDRLCSKERRSVLKNNEEKNRLVMFVGDRGTGVGSRLKGFKRYGGVWKPKVNSRYASVCFTNEHNTSQTCIYCFKKLFHPIRVENSNGNNVAKPVNGSFICINKECISFQSGCSTFSRDTLSALAIGLAGLAKLIFGVTFPCFDHKSSIPNTEKFKQLAGCLLNKKRA